MPTSRLLPFNGPETAARYNFTGEKPALTGKGTYDYLCANHECPAIALKGFDHVQYRIDDSIAFDCQACGTSGSMPQTGYPKGDPKKQISLTTKKR